MPAKKLKKDQKNSPKEKLSKKKSTKVSGEKTTENLVATNLSEVKISKLIPVGLKSRLFIALAILIFGLLFFLGSKYFVVAWVDKQPITRVEYYKALESKYGKDQREQLIVEKLVLDEARQKGISVSNDELNVEIKRIQDQQGGQAQLNQLLQMQNISQNEFSKLVMLQLLRQKLFGGSITVTDDEVSKYMDQNKDQLPQVNSQDASSAAKLKDQIKEQIKQQKINSAFSSWLDSALKSSRVIRN